MIEQASMLQVNGLHMHVVSAGQGPPVLLLHGFPDSHVVWRKQIRVLARAGFHVIAPDLRGYGKTDAPQPVEAYRLDVLCKDVLALLDALDIDKVRLVGHDWGAVIGWRLCLQAPQRIDRFVALSVGHPSALSRAGLEQRLRMFYVVGFLVPGFAEHALRFANWLAVRKFTRDRIQFSYWRRDLSRPGRLTAALNYYRANVNLGLPERASPVTVPVMGIWSDGDAAMGEKQMLDSALFVHAGFRYERIDGADHWMQLTAPDRVNALLLDYFGAQSNPYAVQPR
ncbi:alpha/beta fold hydrolase [Massilia horti]|uniref:Alpha/beta hydrolase n=1 Tax=Massilia horti TaxID=2562153 RepID=A0A4Y9SM10_9BURK|nr:alpha/beta hydrolase [Massilia horti]TFW27471.1 alpha/beta hydrolase [Massilia horti]